jgi:hypothetical protein
VGWIEQFKRGDDKCSHAWGDEQGERHLDHFMWWRVCTKCGEKRTTRALSRGPAIAIQDWISGVSYVIGSRHNLANKEFRYLHCECGNSVRVEFDLGDDGRVVRKASAACDWCGARYGAGSRGPEHRPRGAFWADAPEVE